MRIIIAAGGTGGHLFPGIALAEEFKTKNGSNQVLFIGTKRKMEKRILIPKGFVFNAIEVASLKGKNLFALLKSLVTIPGSILKSILIIKDFNPDLIIGLGGYVSGPVVLAATLMGFKTAIHEQNTLPGLTNRILGKIAHLVFVSFEQSLSYFPKGKTILTGNPIRKGCSEASSADHSRSTFTLLILGGSLGSHQINCAMIDALEDVHHRRTQPDDVKLGHSLIIYENLRQDIHPPVDQSEVGRTIVCQIGTTHGFRHVCWAGYERDIISEHPLLLEKSHPQQAHPINFTALGQVLPAVFFRRHGWLCIPRKGL